MSPCFAQRVTEVACERDGLLGLAEALVGTPVLAIDEHFAEHKSELKLLRTEPVRYLPCPRESLLSPRIIVAGCTQGFAERQVDVAVLCRPGLDQRDRPL